MEERGPFGWLKEAYRRPYPLKISARPGNGNAPRGTSLMARLRGGVLLRRAGPFGRDALVPLFPTGLQLARQSALQHKIPHLFALNAVAGAMAGTLCLYGAIRSGYTWMLAAAFGLYCLAAAIDQLARRATRMA